MKRKLIGYGIIFLWILSRAVKSYSAGDADLLELSMEADRNADAIYSDEASWYLNGEVKFLINIFDEEWEKLDTQEEMIAACQIPDKLLKKFSTDELLKLTEDYPMLGNIYVGDTMKDGFRYIVDSFNGLQELLARDDCLDVVYKEYDKLTFPEYERIDYSEYKTEEELVAYVNEILQNDEMLKIALEDAKSSLVCDLLEMIMLEKTTEYNIETLLDAVTDKTAEKKKAEKNIGFTDKSTYISGLDKSLLLDAGAYTIAESSTTTTKKLYWKGTAIEVEVENNPQYYSKTDALNAISLYKDKGASIVHLGSNKYNCHSYAWLRLAFPNTYDDYGLRNIPDIFIEKCTMYHEPHKMSIAYKAGHSAVVVDETNIRIQHDKPIKDPIVKAKWGYWGPVVKAPMSIGPMGMEVADVYGFYYYGAFPK